MQIAEISLRMPNGRVKEKVFRIRKINEDGEPFYISERRIYFDFNDFKLAR